MPFAASDPRSGAVLEQQRAFGRQANIGGQAGLELSIT
jgi:hypothetical protein